MTAFDIYMAKLRLELVELAKVDPGQVKDRLAMMLLAAGEHAKVLDVACVSFLSGAAAAWGEAHGKEIVLRTHEDGALEEIDTSWASPDPEIDPKKVN